MTRRAYLYFVLTFLLGIVLGAWGMFSYGWYSGQWHRTFSKQRTLRHLKRELNLSDLQVQQLSEIMDDSSKKYKALDEKIEPEYDALRDERRNRIRQILNPEQLLKFNEMIQRLKVKPRKHPH